MGITKSHLPIISLPIQNDEIQSLHCNDIVLLSGHVYTMRDAAHKRLTDTLQQGMAPPFCLQGESIYYTGACPAPKGKAIGACGPTTSSRMDAYTEEMLKQGIKVMIGKGKRSSHVLQQMQQCGAVYFAAIGGAGAVYQNCVTACTAVCYEDLLCEGVYLLQIKNFPVVCAADCHNHSIY